MTAIPEALLKRIEKWCAEHPTGRILLHVADHKVKSFEFSEHGRIEEPKETSGWQHSDYRDHIGPDITLT